MTLTFTTPGTCVPQGSMRGFVVNGQARVTHAKPLALTEWRRAIAASATDAGAVCEDGACIVSLVFNLARGKTVRRAYPTVKPDIDKLARSVLDALTGVCWQDDAQVCDLILSKRYSDTPGLTVTVSRLREEKC